MSWLDNGEIIGKIGDFLSEDLGRGDITTQATVPPDSRGIGRFLAKEGLVLCGLEIAEAVFMHLDPESSPLETTANDGDELASGTIFATQKGFADVLLAGERTALNLIQRMSACKDAPQE